LQIIKGVECNRVHCPSTQGFAVT